MTSARGSTFWLCGLAAVDSRFARYPPLPVLHCSGFRPEASAGLPPERAATPSRHAAGEEERTSAAQPGP